MNDSAQLLRELRIDRQEPPAARNWRPVIIAAVVVVLVAAALVWFTQDGAIEVRTASARAIAASGGGAASVLDASGYVTPRRQATVSSKITGKVKEVLIEEGQRVAEGEVLARLESIDADAQRTLAASQVEAARAQVAQAQAQATMAEKTLVRQRDLAGRKLVAQALLDQAQAERDASAAALTSAKRQLDVAGDSLSVAEIGVDNTVVRAPFAGVVTVKAAQPGEMISPISAGGGFTRTGIGTVVDMESLEVQVDVNEAFIGRVSAKQPIQATLNAYPDWKIPGEVIAIVPTADRGKATIKVRIALHEKDARIVPEMGVRVAFLDPGRASDASAPAPPPGVLVPQDAIVQRDGKSVAFVVSEARAQQREVTLGRTLGEDREVSKGLQGGDVVVLDPPQDLADGAAVRIEEASSND